MTWFQTKVRLPLVFVYKMRAASAIAFVPFFTAVFLLCLVFIFLRLNLYHLEALGLVINDQIRGAYFDLIFREVIAELPKVGIFIAAIFCLGFIVVNWAVSPFVRAERLIRNRCLSGKYREFRYDVHFSENKTFDTLVNDFVMQVEDGLPLEADNRVIRRRLQWRFLFEYIVVFGLVSAISGAVFSSIFLTVYERVVSLGLQLVMVRNLRGHYFNAQQELLTDVLNFSITFSFLAYVWIGLAIRRHLSINLFVFSRVIAERRFPIPMHSRQTYYGLADALNRAFLKHRQNRI